MTHPTSETQWEECARVFQELRNMGVPELRIRTLWEENAGDPAKIQDEIANRMESTTSDDTDSDRQSHRPDTGTWNSDKVCAICQDEDLLSVRASELVQFDCGHKIHRHCANEMLRVAHRDAPASVLLIDCPYHRLCSGKLHFQESRRHCEHYESRQPVVNGTNDEAKLWRWYLDIVKKQILRAAGWLECPSAECRKHRILVRVLESADSSRVQCAACGAEYCARCSIDALRTVENHEPLPCDARISMREVHRVIDEQLSALRQRHDALRRSEYQNYRMGMHQLLVAGFEANATAPAVAPRQRNPAAQEAASTEGLVGLQSQQPARTGASMEPSAAAAGTTTAAEVPGASEGAEVGERAPSPPARSKAPAEGQGEAEAHSARTRWLQQRVWDMERTTNALRARRDAMVVDMERRARDFAQGLSDLHLPELPAAVRASPAATRIFTLEAAPWPSLGSFERLHGTDTPAPPQAGVPPGGAPRAGSSSGGGGVGGGGGGGGGGVGGEGGGGGGGDGEQGSVAASPSALSFARMRQHAREQREREEGGKEKEEKEEVPVRLGRLIELAEQFGRVCSGDLKTLKEIQAGTYAPAPPPVLTSDELMHKTCKPCPKCEHRIEKNGGCRHMVCVRCRHEFCWSCLRPHRECGNFQCSRAPVVESFRPELQEAIRMVAERYDPASEQDARSLPRLFAQMVEYAAKYLQPNAAEQPDERTRAKAQEKMAELETAARFRQDREREETWRRQQLRESRERERERAREMEALKRLAVAQQARGAEPLLRAEEDPHAAPASHAPHGELEGAVAEGGEAGGAARLGESAREKRRLDELVRLWEACAASLRAAERCKEVAADFRAKMDGAESLAALADLVGRALEEDARCASFSANQSLVHFGVALGRLPPACAQRLDDAREVEMGEESLEGGVEEEAALRRSQPPAHGVPLKRARATPTLRGEQAPRLEAVIAGMQQQQSEGAGEGGEPGKAPHAGEEEVVGLKRRRLLREQLVAERRGSVLERVMALVDELSKGARAAPGAGSLQPTLLRLAHAGTEPGTGQPAPYHAQVVRVSVGGGEREAAATENGGGRQVLPLAGFDQIISGGLERLREHILEEMERRVEGLRSVAGRLGRAAALAPEGRALEMPVRAAPLVVPGREGRVLRLLRRFAVRDRDAVERILNHAVDKMRGWRLQRAQTTSQGHHRLGAAGIEG